MPMPRNHKKKKNLQLFYIKTTPVLLSLYMFAVNNYLINFAMEKDSVKTISVWEKVSDFMMDISKYVLTAVIITSAFEELSDVGWLMYVFGVAGAALFLAVSVFMLSIANKGK